jgi:hypothetical protein
VKFNRSITSIVSVILAWVMSCGLLLLMPEKSWADSGVKLSSQIPANPSELSFDDVGEFAWKTFVALNWPANCSDGSSLGNIGEYPTHPRVWEFYDFPKNIFVQPGKEPTSKVVPYQCRALTESTPDPDEADLDEISIYLPGELSNPRSQVLVDRFGNYVINETRMNPVEVDQVVRNQWYSATKLANKKFDNNVSSAGNPFQFLCSVKDKDGTYPTAPLEESPKAPCRTDDTKGQSESDDTSMGAIELKAAWMVLSNPDTSKPSPLPDLSKYYTTRRTFNLTNQDGSITKVENVSVALIGFHIIQKTSKTGWVWSTFEQVDNAPNAKNSNCYKPPRFKEPDYYNLYNPQSNSIPNESLATPPYLWGKKFPYAVTTGNNQQTPSQITRQVCIPQFAADLNRTWQEERLQGSVWQNYQLIGVQWLGSPSTPYPYSQGNLSNQQLINVALEPYPQSKNHDNTGFSCVACHQQAKLPESVYPNKIYSDFSFMMSHAK